MQPLSSVNPTSVSGDKCAKVDDESQQETAIDWNAVIGADESCLLGNASASKDTVVRAGSIVRMVSIYKVHRQSEFLHGTLNLDPHRCNSLITAIHACWLARIAYLGCVSFWQVLLLLAACAHASDRGACEANVRTGNVHK